jgi:hypothetical protein
MPGDMSTRYYIGDSSSLSLALSISPETLSYCICGRNQQKALMADTAHASTISARVPPMRVVCASMCVCVCVCVRVVCVYMCEERERGGLQYVPRYAQVFSVWERER